jgi:hypothetical protein
MSLGPATEVALTWLDVTVRTAEAGLTSLLRRTKTDPGAATVPPRTMQYGST